MSVQLPDPSEVPPPSPVARALSSLRGLAVGDAFGSRFFVPGNLPSLRERVLPAGPWRWTDDTEMACSVLAVLARRGSVDQDALAAAFAEHHDTGRDYGASVSRMLRLVGEEGADWRQLASGLFDGQGSWGNGAAMRVAPLGAWYAGAPERAAEEGERSAVVTHQHREAVAGAVAVAVAASLAAARTRGGPPGPGMLPGPEERPEAGRAGAAAPGGPAAGRAGGGGRAGTEVSAGGPGLLAEVLDMVPRGAVQAGVRRALDMLDYGDAATVAAVLGCGRRTSAHDTVPFALWAAARHLDDFESALWATASAGGDVDTTCAIVGGVLAAGGPSAAPPQEWRRRTEPLPDWVPTA